ncbi:MAG: DUF1501 domain-containing protein [Bryobacteraceae bacterium]
MTSRRHFLTHHAMGFGALSLAALRAEAAATDPFALRAPHFKPRAKAVILLYMDGGVSHIDSFDPKPAVAKYAGQPIPVARPKLVRAESSMLWASPFPFAKYGHAGADVSNLFPHVASMVDDLAIVRSMVADHSEHTAANYFMHSGSGLQGRPSMGAWISYGLGNESRNLPGYVVLDTGMIPPGGLDLFSAGFLPASYQGSLFRRGRQPVADLAPRDPARQRAKLDLLRDLDQGASARYGNPSDMQAAIANYELAFRMQAAVPELANIEGESQATRQLYGIGERDTEDYGRACLIARRLVERGVRFVEVLSPRREGFDRWDQHADLIKGHTVNAKATDRPMWALVQDLKARGMLDDTLVLWTGEFGRSPTVQGAGERVGRDHHPYAFSLWMAGGGVKPGVVYGSTDDFGFYPAENKVHVHDLHATILHLLGLDHKRLDYAFGGRQMRLTDVHGQVVQAIVAD